MQIAAAAAAAAVFSNSMRLFSNNFMHRVNAEWDAALRWIAGWDQHQQQEQQRQQPPMRADNEGSNTGGATSKDEGGDNNTQEGFHSFVDWRMIGSSSGRRRAMPGKVSWRWEALWY